MKQVNITERLLRWKVLSKARRKRDVATHRGFIRLLKRSQ